MGSSVDIIWFVLLPIVLLQSGTLSAKENTSRESEELLTTTASESREGGDIQEATPVFTTSVAPKPQDAEREGDDIGSEDWNLNSTTSSNAALAVAVGEERASNESNEDQSLMTTAPSTEALVDMESEERSEEESEDDSTTTAVSAEEATTSDLGDDGLSMKDGVDDDDDDHGEEVGDDGGEGDWSKATKNTTATPDLESPDERSVQGGRPDKGSAGFDRCLVRPYPCQKGYSCRMINGKVRCYRQRCSEGICNGRGSCVEVPDGYRCVCSGDFKGDNCESVSKASSVCDPNPCKGDCDCFDSCQHELGYFCSSRGGFMGKNCTIPVPKVVCGQRSISIDIPELFYVEFDKGLRNTYFYMAQDTRNAPAECMATNVGGSFRIHLPLPFSGCGSKKERSGDAVVVKNRVYVDRRSDLFSMAIPLLDFECRYEREYRLITSLRPVIAKPSHLDKNGRFDPSVELCKIAACPAPCPQRYSVAEGAVYTVGEIIYLRATALPESGFKGFVTTVVSASMSCDRREAGLLAMNLIDGGCPVATGLPASVITGQSACIAFQAPRAPGCTRVYIHLHLLICDPTELSKCEGSEVQKCGADADRRRRRSAEDSIEGVVIVVGPLLFINGSEGDEQISIFPMAATSEAAVYKNGRLVPSKAAVYENGDIANPDTAGGTTPGTESIPEGRLLMLATSIPTGVLMAVILMLLLACGFSSDTRRSLRPGRALRRRRLFSSASSVDCFCNDSQASILTAVPVAIQRPSALCSCDNGGETCSCCCGSGCTPGKAA